MLSYNRMKVPAGTLSEPGTRLDTYSQLNSHMNPINLNPLQMWSRVVMTEQSLQAKLHAKTNRETKTSPQTLEQLTP